MNIRTKKQAVKRFLLTIFLFTITIIFILKLFNLEKVENPRVIVTNGTSIFLENLLGTDHDILMDSSIFFLDTTRMRNPQRQRDLTIRQICSIESAALTNPDSRIFVIIVSPIELTKSIRHLPQMNAILDYPNVFLKSMHLVQYTIDTPLEEFIANRSIFASRFIRAHTADVLRLLFLWKFGGTYLDTDIIVRQNLSSFPDNFICRDHGFLNNAIMSLRGESGRKFAKMFINDMIDNYNPKEWGENGPVMLYRVLKNVCKTENVRKMKNCDGFHVMEDDLCYPVKGTTWELLFDEKKGEEIWKKMQKSIVVHFWNKLSHKQKLTCNSTAAYTRIAREFCPKTMSYCVDYFWGWKEKF